MPGSRRYDVKGYQFFCLPVKEKSWSIEAYSYYFPEVLASLLISEKDRKHKRAEYEKKYLHLSELNAWILALYPNVFSAKSLYPSQLHQPWILSIERLPIHELNTLVCAWVENHPGCPRFLPSFSIREERIEIPWLNKTYPNGTANPICEKEELGLNAFNIWPQYFGRLLNGMQFSWEKDERFVSGMLFSSLPSSDKGAVRLICWPPQGKRKNWSYQIKISLQTIPEDPFPYLYLHPQTIRFAKNTYLRKRDARIGVIMRMTHSRNGNASPGFSEWSGMPITRMKDWTSFSKKMCSLFQLELPSYESFRNEPLNNIHDQSVAMLPLHSANMEYDHPVKAGLSPIDRYFLAEQVKKNLTEKQNIFLESCPQREKIDLPRKGKQLKIDQFDLPRTFLFIRLSKEENVWQEEMLRALQTELKLEIKDGKHFRRRDKSEVEEVEFIIKSAEEFWGTDPYHIEIQDQITEDSKEEEAIVHARKAYAEKIRQKVVSHFPDDKDGQVFAFIELPNKDQFQRGLDPKQILRRELAKKGILTQFITPADQALSQAFSMRCKNGIFDMLRQMGVIKWKIDSVLSVSTACVGIHLIRSKKKVVLLLTAIFGDQVYTYVDHEAGWIPYPKAIIQLVRRGSGKLGINQASVAAFIHEAIKQLRRRFSPQHIVLYGVAENLRNYIPWIKNPGITRDRVWLSEDISLETDVSFVRLRGSGNEAPEWVAYGKEIDNDDKSDGPLPSCLQTHLVSWNDRLFFGVGKRPDSARGMSNHIHNMKIDREDVYFRMETAVEIFIPVCNENAITPKELAVFTQLLRQRATIQFKDYLFAPLPLHLSSLLAEYLIDE